MNVTVNGDARDLPDGATVSALIAHLGLPERKVAVERNMEIVPKSRYGATALSDGDRIEIVHFIGGG